MAKFITFEGVEGAGKSTQIGVAARFLESRGLLVEVTREPGGTSLGERLRELLLHDADADIRSDTELMLMFAARRQHLEARIWPALEAGRWVLCDRFTDATYAYQGYGRGVDLDRIATLETWVQGDFRPHATFVYDVPVELGLARARERGEPDRFEAESLAFFERVRNGYLTRARLDPERCQVIDASLALAQVSATTEAVLEGRIEGLR